MTDYIGPDPSMPIIRARIHGEVSDRLQILADGTFLRGDGHGSPSPLVESGKLNKGLPVIVDSDHAGDPDDWGDIRLACGQHRRGAFDLKAVVVSSVSPNAGVSMSMQLTDECVASTVPMGVYTGSAEVAGMSQESGFIATQASALIHEYPYTAGPYEDAVRTVRRALAARQQQDLVYFVMGFLGIVKAVLQSPADDLSPLTGQQLWAKAVKKLVIAGGNWPNYATASQITSVPTVDWNFSQSPASSSYVVANCPSPIEFYGNEVCVGITQGKVLQGLAATDHVRRFFSLTGVLTSGRNAYGATAMYAYSYEDPANAGFTFTTGTATIDALTGANDWTNSPGGKHRYARLTATKSAVGAQIDRLLVPGYEPEAPEQAAIRPSRGPRAEPFTPALLSNPPVVWLKASGLPAIAASVSSWAQSYPASAPAATQATSGKQPVVATGFRELPCVQFDGTTKYLDIADPAVRIAKPLVFVVFTSAQASGVGTQNVLGVPEVDGSHTTPFYRYGVVIPTTLYVRGYANGNADNTPANVRDLTVPRLVESDPAARRVWVDSRIDTDNSPDSDVTYTNPTPLRISGNGAGGENLKGNIYEIVVLDGMKTTAAERWAVSDYFYRKYGIPRLGLSQ